jgi:hypothetical protein
MQAPGRQSLRQRQGRALHQNPQERRDRRDPLSRSPRRGGPHRRLHRPGLQSPAPALHARLSNACRVRGRAPGADPRHRALADGGFQGCGNLRRCPMPNPPEQRRRRASPVGAGRITVSFRPAIPRWVAPQQSPLPLRRPRPCTTGLHPGTIDGGQPVLFFSVSPMGCSSAP